MKKSSLFIVLLFGLLVMCEPAPEKINFGQDACAYCSMGIADPSFAAEIVTTKGRVYKYDSIECMVRSYKTMEQSVAMVLVMDYANPGAFINAKEAFFLKSDETRSPMGANLSAFEQKEAIEKQNLIGQNFDWENLIHHIE